MKCSNNQCPSKLEPGTIECPAANDGCKDYKRLVTNAEKMMASPNSMVDGIFKCMHDCFGTNLYEICRMDILKWLSKEAEG